MVDLNYLLNNTSLCPVAKNDPLIARISESSPAESTFDVGVRRSQNAINLTKSFQRKLEILGKVSGYGK